jgi:ligand-binding sensor domain-containing protein/serine phosphatase RsbU (regulator of sigma subunit)
MRTYSTESGLSNSRISAIVQDHQGFLWVATSSGVSRTDGRTFKNYTPKQGLAGDKVTSLAVDGQNRIWAGHQGSGISIIGHDTIIIINESAGLVNNEVNALHYSQDGKMWVGTFAGITVFDGLKGQSYSTANGLSANNIRALAEDASGQMWIGTFGAGITLAKGRKFYPFMQDEALPNMYITDLHATENGMLIGTMDGAFHHQNGTIATLLSAVGQVNTVMQSGESLWFGTFSGLARLLDDATLLISDKNGLPSNEMTCLFSDMEGNLWVGTAKGLVRIGDLALTYYPANAEQALEPNGLFKDSKGLLVAANSLGGIMRREDGVFVPALDDPDINDHVIGPIVEDLGQTLWFGTKDFGGLFQWDGKRVYNYSDAFGLVDNNINCLLRVNSGEVFIGTPSGLSSMSNGEFAIIPMMDEPGTEHITSMLNTSDGRLMIGSLDGTLSQYVDGAVRTIDTEIKIDAPINHLSETKEGIWVATEGNGAFLLNGDRLIHYGANSGIPDLNVRSIMSVGNDLFAGTSSGIFRLMVGDTNVEFQSIGANHQIGLLECRAGSILKEGSKVWFGTSKGVVCVKAREIRKRLAPPKLYFEGLQLFYHTVNWGERGLETDTAGMPTELVLGYDDNYLRFHFKALSLSDPDHVRYRWMLEGYETEWAPFSNAEMANYPNLPPGTYTFKVMACTGDDACTKEVLSYSFRVKPPMWQTLWFYGLLALIAVSVTYTYIRWRERKLKKEKRLLEATVEERTRELREQKEIVEDQNRHITESIDYARNIQMAVLPSEEEMKRAFAAHFVLYRPKETVGGDFYWVYTHGDITWAAAIDCTGHGVAGAFMSMIGTDLLNQNIIEKQVSDPAQVLTAMDKGIKLAFAQSASEFEGDKGMDICLIKIDRLTQTVAFAGAQRPLYVAVNNDVTELEGDSVSISCIAHGSKRFNTKDVKLVPGMRLFLFSDGYADQFGGSKGKKFMTRQLKEVILSCLDRPMTEQYAALEHALDAWRGTEYPQLDDILVMGIQL